FQDTAFWRSQCVPNRRHFSQAVSLAQDRRLFCSPTLSGPKVFAIGDLLQFIHCSNITYFTS
ncbi:unnamed protein product, partial [Cylicocyclus nassatus]